MKNRDYYGYPCGSGLEIKDHKLVAVKEVEGVIGVNSFTKKNIAGLSGIALGLGVCLLLNYFFHFHAQPRWFE